MTTQSFRCKTHAHIHTTVSEVIKKVFIQGFRTISENQCLLQILKVTMIGRRDIIKAFKDSNRYEHVRLKISVWQSLSERRSQNSDAETEIDDNTIPYHQYLLDAKALVIQRNMRNAELVQENDLLKSTLSGKEKSIAFLQ
ncbi:hypothetical protein Tco_0056020 [Tanacetum coccineum]